MHGLQGHGEGLTWGWAVSDPEPPPLASSPSCPWGVRSARPGTRVHPPAEIQGPLAARPGALLPETQAVAPGAQPDRLPEQPAGVSRAAFPWSEAGPAASSPAGGPLPGGPAHTVFLELNTDDAQTPARPGPGLPGGAAVSTSALQLSQALGSLGRPCSGPPQLPGGTGHIAEPAPGLWHHGRAFPSAGVRGGQGQTAQRGLSPPGFPGRPPPGARLLRAGRCVTVRRAARHPSP